MITQVLRRLRLQETLLDGASLHAADLSSLYLTSEARLAGCSSGLSRRKGVITLHGCSFSSGNMQRFLILPIENYS